MRRAVLFDAYPHVEGGAQRTDHLLARGLPERGWALTTITPGDGPYPARLRAEGLPLEVVPTPPALSRYGRVTVGRSRIGALVALPAYWWRLARVLRRLRPEVVHVVDHRGIVLAGVAARLAGTPVVWHVQALDRTPAINRWGARLARAVVVPTAAVVPKLTGLPADTAVTVIPNVVPDRVRQPRTGPPPSGSAPVVVTTARLHPDKGLDVLVEALALVRTAVPDAVVRVLGGPQDGFEDLGPALLAQAEALGVGGAVELVGFVEDPAVEVARARCYVQPARERTEILPLAILEAMAVGTPVVATDVGGVADLVTTDATGVLVPAEDPAALAAALVRVLTEPGLGARLAAGAAARLADPRYGETGLLDAVAACYRRVVGG